MSICAACFKIPRRELNLTVIYVIASVLTVHSRQFISGHSVFDKWSTGVKYNIISALNIMKYTYNTYRYSHVYYTLIESCFESKNKAVHFSYIRQYDYSVQVLSKTTK